MIIRKNQAIPLAEVVCPEAGEITAHTALRGLAALMVVLYHCALTSPDVTLGPLTALVQRGYLFVDIFFILSGFILMRRYGASLAHPSRNDLLQFWRRRLLRIYPPYIVWLTLAILVWFLVGMRGEGPQYEADEHLASIVLHATMLQSILGLEIQYNVPLWSIAMEMAAYLLLPLFAMSLVPLSRSGICILIVILLGGVWLFIRHYGTLDVIGGPGALARCLLGFCLGALSSLLSSTVPKGLARWSRPTSFFMLALTLLAFTTGHIFMGYCTALGMVMISSLQTTSSWTRTWLPMLLGRVSFSLYLAHIPVMSVMVLVTAKLESTSDLPLFSSFPVFATLVVVASVLAAVLSWKYVEVGLTARVGSVLGRQRMA
ncbi:acyltransferase family protein [Hydrogenophaga sp.]|uniref:acyltransferase family protein n=1 Tax=Hydrogenophaga sp. TaxID=1904254 RepID=UPI003D12E27D